MICNNNNPCSGKYGLSIDIKLTNVCNGKCVFCIEEGGYSPKEMLEASELASRINANNAKSVLLLGGEPLLYPDLITLLDLIKNKSIFLTTNGSLLTPGFASQISPYLTGLNISIHHYLPEKNQELTKVLVQNIKSPIYAFGPSKVRINCNLIKGYIDSREEIDKMCEFAKSLGVSRIRFAELQFYPDLFVDAKTIFPELANMNPFTDGCEIELNKTSKLGWINRNNLDVTLRITCGLINPDKPLVNEPENRNPMSNVMYNNGEVHDNWVGEPNENASCHGSTSGGCS